MFNNIRADLRAYDGNWGAQGFWVMVVYRFGRWRYGVRPTLVRKFFSLIYHVLYKVVQIVTGIELPCEVEVGHNFVIDHFGGIIISGYASSGITAGFAMALSLACAAWKRNMHRSSEIMSILAQVRNFWGKSKSATTCLLGRML